MLWIFSRLSQAPLALPMVPVVAANLWHLGVLIGTVAILMGDSSGYTWLEYPRAAAVLLFTAFMLIAITAVATFGFRQNRELFPAHWFLLGALLLFAGVYSTGNLFLLSHYPPRGVVQAVIGWWYANNLVFVWLALMGIGTAFYFLPKIAGRPLASSGYALFAFLTLILFGSWMGIPQGSPVPAWLPSVSSVAAGLTLVPLVAILVVTLKTTLGANVSGRETNFNFIKFGVAIFISSSLLYICQFCPQYARVLEFTWFGFAQTQLQLLGFTMMILIGAIYEILPRIMGGTLPFGKFAKLHFALALGGVLLFVLPLILAGTNQGHMLADSRVPFADVTGMTLKLLRISTTGQLILLAGALLFALNIFVMTIKWKLGLMKSALAAIQAPLETGEVKS
jgi:cytochrome c oxidase cbb3-type subunit 1